MKCGSLSLQKYIIAVNDQTIQNNVITDRRNKNASNSSKVDIASIEEYIGAPAFDPDENGNRNARGPYKSNNPVIIEAGDIVTYIIEVYNNGNFTEDNIEVKDFLRYYDGNSTQEINDEDIYEVLTTIGNKPIIYKNGSTTGQELGYNADNESFDTFSLDSKQYATIQFKVKIKKQIDSNLMIANYAKIENGDPNYRTMDADYVIVDSTGYSVKLEKYISKVNVNDVTDRSEKAEYGTLTETDKENEWIQRNTYKVEHPQKVELNSKVEYTIKITNTGEKTIKNIKIKDELFDKNQGSKISGAMTVSAQIDCNVMVTAYSMENGEIEFVFKNELTNAQSCCIKIEYSANRIQNKFIKNTATILSIQNKNGIDVTDGDGIWNNTDSDYIEILEEYAVSLEKYVSKVTDKDGNSPVEYTNDRTGKAEHKYDNDANTYDDTKYKKVVEVSQGDLVTYTIKVNNDSTNTKVYISEIIDYLPNGVEYNNIKYNGNKYCTKFEDIITDNVITFNNLSTELLEPKASASFEVTVKVIESNMSVNILKNTAKITKIKSQSGNEMIADDADTTPNNNTDSDYIQMKDITISGTVWNDKALDKQQNNYNGLIDESESKLNNINVKLFRENSLISSKDTNNGDYKFAPTSYIYIKGPKVENTNRWVGTYYSYYVVFEYDGVTYTSTNFADITSDNPLDSNARERLDSKTFNGHVNKNRTDFNNSFNPNSGIEYDTKNESGYIPQSIHKYNPSTMSIQSSTSLINLKELAESDDGIEEKLQHVNLGLRGRDTFDLQLTSDVDNIEVTVNNQKGVYNYTNKVILRESDLSPKNYVDSKEQKIRTSDIENSKYSEDQLLSSIQVTYKITVQNDSFTEGTAIKINNYYDNNYSFVRAYSGSEEMTIENGKVINKEDGTLYKFVEITTPGTMLKQSEKMEIYVVYTLNNARNTLKDIEKLATYNMAEISEYKTHCAEGQTEYTRGLLDKDSEPGSASREKVRTTETETKNKTPKKYESLTTVEYYFKANNPSKLKYEDDTYATPILYFVKDNSDRVITGTVFEDKTTTNPTTKIKSGNGKLDEGEIGVYGATVELIEQIDGGKVRDTQKTDKNGKYSFEGFLPGNYKIKYSYGDKVDTVILGKGVIETDEKGKVTKLINAKSYNGEDFQSTNNTGKNGGSELSKTEKYWYLDNEKDGISTATDDTERRNAVKSYMVGDNSNEKMIVLNNVRSGKEAEAAEVRFLKDNKEEKITVDNLISGTYMFADTPNMLLELEKPRNIENGYIVENMNFGIAEVPVTKINLQKNIKEFTILDSTGNNILAGYKEGNVIGNVIKANNNFDVSIEDSLLQGAELTITFEITQNMQEEFNFTGENTPTATKLTGLIDFIDNNLSYNPNLNGNSDNWEIISGSNATGTSIDPNAHSVILRAKENNPIIKDGKPVTVTLEKVLSSPDISLAQMLTSLSDEDIYNYANIVEITGINSSAQSDRIRTNDSRYIFLLGQPTATAKSGELIIHPPTGNSSINIMYYAIVTVGLVIIAVGVFSIKKFVLKK